MPTPTVISKIQELVFIPPEYRTRQVTYCYTPTPSPPPGGGGPGGGDPGGGSSGGDDNWVCQVLVLGGNLVRVCVGPTGQKSIVVLGPA